MDDSLASPSPTIQQTGGITGPDGAITHYVMSVAGEQSFIVFGSDERPSASPMWLRELRHHIHVPYDIECPEAGWRAIESFGEAEKAKLRPVAETLAMLAGNAFFDISAPTEHYESYLPEASALYEANGGDRGWAGLASFARDGGAKQPSTATGSAGHDTP